MDSRDERRVQEMERKILSLETKLEDTSKEFSSYKDEKQREEARRLRTALISAGGVILTLGGFVWAEIIWPVISVGRFR